MTAIEQELAKLVLMDRKLIAKHDLFKRKLERLPVEKAVKEKKYDRFFQEYLDMRVKIGNKRLYYRQKQLDLVGNPSSVKIKECNLDSFLEKV